MTDTSAFLGCWDLWHGPWPRSQGLLSEVPPRVRLSSSPDTSPRVRPAALLMLVAPGAMPSIHTHTYWRPLGRDSARLFWSTDLVGVIATLGLRGDSLVGSAMVFTDVQVRNEPPNTSVFTGTRVPCSAPLPAAARARYEYLRGVQLSTGDSVRLGEPLPRSAETVPDLTPYGGPGVVWVRTPVSGLFAGATKTRAFMDRSGPVHRIELVFGPEAYDRLRTDLAHELGPGRPMPMGERVLWSGHMVTLMLMRDGPGPASPQGSTWVYILDPAH